MRRSIAVLVLVLLAWPLPARGQARSSATTPDHGYIEGNAQSAFGNVTSQSYGAEVGFAVTPDVQLFVEGGRVRNVATSEISASAQAIASFLSASNANVTFTVKQPVTFVGAGVRYLVPVQSQVRPYVVVGAGVAKVRQDVRFLIGGTDITSTATQYGVQLGSDLSGDFTKPLLTLGAGVMVPLWHQLGLDLQYRYGRIFAEGQGINVSRAGLGIAIGF